MKTLILDGQECVLITREALMDLLHDRDVSMRENRRKGLSDVNECLEILGCGYSTFRKRVNAKGSYIRSSSVKGKYITESIIKERDR